MQTKRIERKPDSLLERIASQYIDGLTDRTREEYARKMGAMANDIRRSDRLVTPATVAAHLERLSSDQTIAQATCRTLKAAAIFWLSEEAQHALARGDSLLEFEAAYARIRDTGTAELPARTERTSSTKLKYLPKAMLDELSLYAVKTPQRYGGALIAFLRANILVGLRPAEWFGARWMTYLHRESNGAFARRPDGRIKTTLALHVDNAKATHGRGNGESRDILLHQISDSGLATLMHWHDIVDAFANTYPADTPQNVLARNLYKPLQQWMNQALKKLGHSKALPTTYSTRHQAVADAKSSRLSDREIAAMFGHSSTATAKCHYGRRIHGWGQTTFRPSPESLAAVPDRRAHIERDLAAPTSRLVRKASAWNRRNE